MALVQTVVISSTARDLPNHRQKIMDACIKLGMFPKMMEHLPASDLNAIEASMNLVDSADVYIGVFAFRYGYVPTDGNPQKISITEMEYNRAIQRSIPRLVFFMDKLHPITVADTDEDTTDPVETARRKVKLKELKERAGLERVANFFKSDQELHSQVILALIGIKSLALQRSVGPEPEERRVVTIPAIMPLPTQAPNLQLPSP